MKKNRVMRTAVFILTLTLLTSCFVGGTFAKYTSTATGTDTAKVAKWSFTVDDTDIAKTDSFKFNLFDTTDDIIEPGAEGTINIALINDSEVDVEYSIGFKVTNTDNIPIEYSTGTGKWTTDLNSMAESKSIAESSSGNLSVNWRWAYEGNRDTADTALGVAAAEGKVPSITVEATVTATQVN